MAVLEIQNIGFYYYQNKIVLEDISLSFERGKFYAICGPSGCGKTTLLTLIGGLVKPKEGNILCNEKDIQGKGLEWHRKNNVAFIFQNYNLIDYLTAKENVLLTAKENPLASLRRVGITDEEARRNVLKLSGGQQQRVAIARALASQAPIILADEPTGNLDEDTASEITQLLKSNAHELNRCVIVVTHSDAVAREADEVFYLSYGKLKKKEVFSEKSEDLEKVKQAVHDVKNHFVILKEYEAAGEFEELGKYLNEITDEIWSRNSRRWTGNRILDIILNQKKMLSEDKGVEFDIETVPLNDRFLTDSEISSLFGNLLDNAIEACEKISGDEKWISVSIRRQKELLFIEVANTAVQAPVEEEGRLITSKPDKEFHGIGSANVRRIVGKYGGDIVYQFHKGIFKANITFYKIPEIEE